MPMSLTRRWRHGVIAMSYQSKNQTGKKWRQNGCCCNFSGERVTCSGDLVTTLTCNLVTGQGRLGRWVEWRRVNVNVARVIVVQCVRRLLMMLMLVSAGRVAVSVKPWCLLLQLAPHWPQHHWPSSLQHQSTNVVSYMPSCIAHDRDT